MTAPDAQSSVYRERRFRPSAYNGPVSLIDLSRHGDRSRLRRYARQLFAGWLCADHCAASDAFTAEACELDAAWASLADRAHLAAFSVARGLFDYRISGIGRDEYSATAKDQLRHIAHRATACRDARDIHRVLAGRKALAAPALARLGT